MIDYGVEIIGTISLVVKEMTIYMAVQEAMTPKEVRDILEEVRGLMNLTEAVTMKLDYDEDEGDDKDDDCEEF